MNHKISVTIITFNEEAYIEDCLRSAWRIADEIIVVDSFSSDKTRDIAAGLNAKVVSSPFEGYGLQKEKAAQYAGNAWILNIDADERLDDRMAEEISRLDFIHETADAYAFRRKNYIGSRWQKVWYPDYVIRLYHKEKCKFSKASVHESIMTSNYKKMQGNIVHYSYRDLSDCIVRADKYSKLDAIRMIENRRTIRGWDPVFHASISFLKFFFLKKGFAYGVDGLNASMIGALRSYLKYAHALELVQCDSDVSKVKPEMYNSSE